jgi:hypothetical protein
MQARIDSIRMKYVRELVDLKRQHETELNETKAKLVEAQAAYADLLTVHRRITASNRQVMTDMKELTIEVNAMRQQMGEYQAANDRLRRQMFRARHERDELKRAQTGPAATAAAAASTTTAAVTTAATLAGTAASDAPPPLERVDGGGGGGGGQARAAEEPTLIFPCMICHSNPINCCLVPCGHTMCLTCFEKLKGLRSFDDYVPPDRFLNKPKGLKKYEKMHRRCPFCRVIVQTNSLYLSM